MDVTGQKEKRCGSIIFSSAIPGVTRINTKDFWGLLRAKSYFEFADYSVPRDDPIHNARTVSKLRQAIRNKMARAASF